MNESPERAERGPEPPSPEQVERDLALRAELTAHRERNRRLLRSGGSYAALGLEMGLSVALCLAAGMWLDEHFGTNKVFGLAGIFLGLAAAGRALWRVVRKLQTDEAQGTGLFGDEEEAAVASAPPEEPPEGGDEDQP